MAFTPEQQRALEAPLNPAHVASRQQSGQRLSYVEGWHCIAEANRIFGFDAWDRETIDIRCVSERERKIGRPPNQRDGWGVSYVARVRVKVGDRVREGVGAGHGIDADCGLAHESAIKEAETDAMKRALMTFGNPFGLALYDKTQANVGVEAPAEIHAITDKYVTKGGFERKTAERLTEGESATVLKTLKEAMRFARNVASVREWLKTNNATINSLVDRDYDAFRTDLEEYKESLPKEQVAA